MRKLTVGATAVIVMILLSCTSQDNLDGNEVDTFSLVGASSSYLSTTRPVLRVTSVCDNPQVTIELGTSEPLEGWVPAVPGQEHVEDSVNIEYRFSDNPRYIHQGVTPIWFPGLWFVVDGDTRSKIRPGIPPQTDSFDTETFVSDIFRGGETLTVKVSGGARSDNPPKTVTFTTTDSRRCVDGKVEATVGAVNEEVPTEATKADPGLPRLPSRSS